MTSGKIGRLAESEQLVDTDMGVYIRDCEVVFKISLSEDVLNLGLVLVLVRRECFHFLGEEDTTSPLD